MARFGPRPRPLADRFWPKVEVCGPKECWPWKACTDHHGYGQIGYGGGRRHIKAHRASWMINRGELPEGLGVLHECDNPRCVNPNHLFLGMQAVNHDDMKAKRRGNIGERHGHAKLTDAAVLRIRAGGETPQTFAKMFGVALRTVEDVIEHRSWRHLLGAA